MTMTWQALVLVLLLLEGHDSLYSLANYSDESEMNQQQSDSERSRIKCKVSTSDITWQIGNERPDIKVDISIDGMAKLSGLPSVHLVALPKKDDLHREEYWAPFDIATGMPTEKNQKLYLLNGADSNYRSVRLVPGKLLWASIKSSVWPSQSFAGTVPLGHYSLQVQIELESGKVVSSNEVAITVVK